MLIQMSLNYAINLIIRSEDNREIQVADFFLLDHTGNCLFVVCYLSSGNYKQKTGKHRRTYHEGK